MSLYIYIYIYISDYVKRKIKKNVKGLANKKKEKGGNDDSIVDCG